MWQTEHDIHGGAMNLQAHAEAAKLKAIHQQLWSVTSDVLTELETGKQYTGAEAEKIGKQLNLLLRCLERHGIEPVEDRE